MLNTVSFWGVILHILQTLRGFIFETVQLQASVPGFVTLGKLLNVFKNLFYHLENEHKKKSYFPVCKMQLLEVLWRSSELIHIKCLDIPSEVHVNFSVKTNGSHTGKYWFCSFCKFSDVFYWLGLTWLWLNCLDITKWPWWLVRTSR